MTPKMGDIFIITKNYEQGCSSFCYSILYFGKTKSRKMNRGGDVGNFKSRILDSLVINHCD
jgi:hypothetical protein